MTSTKTRQQRLREQLVETIANEFVWGPILTIHVVGEHYMIVEYETTRPGNASRGWKPEIRFHPYVDAHDTNHSYSTLDDALVACVAWRHETKNDGSNVAANSRAHEYFMKMIGATER